MVAGAEPSEPVGATTNTCPHPLDGVQAISLREPSGPAKYTFWLWLSGSKLVAGAEPSERAGAITEAWSHPLDGVHEISRNDPSVPSKYTFWLWFSGS